MSTTLILPPGPLGVIIKDVDSQCVVCSKSNSKAPLEIGDTIVSLNGITLSEVEGGLDAWKTLFSTFAHGTRTVVVQRPARAVPQKQSSFGSVQEEKKDEYEPASHASQAKKVPSPTRKSSRKRVSTTIVVDGHAIKRSNNYTVTGINYIHGAFTADAPKEKKAKPTPAQTAPKKSRARAAWEIERLKHNDVIKKLMVKDETSQLEFMTRNADVLEPFMEDKIKLLLKANSQVVDKTKILQPIVLGAQPDIVTTPLRDYQMIGLSWMIDMHSQGMPFILGDEMGLGKTLQTISLIAYLKESKGFVGPSLVVCPLSVLYSWCAEIKKHAPTLNHFRFHSSDADEREHQKHLMVHEILKYDIVVTTYEMLKNPQLLGLIRNTYFNLCVLDEGHVIKSKTTQVSEAARKVHCQTRVILTGTPLQNNLVELFAILNYMYPTYFTSPDRFEDSFDITHNKIDPAMLLKANKLLKLFMIRRLKCEVEKLMPKKIETKVCIVMIIHMLTLQVINFLNEYLIYLDFMPS